MERAACSPYATAFLSFLILIPGHTDPGGDSRPLAEKKHVTALRS